MTKAGKLIVALVAAVVLAGIVTALLPEAKEAPRPLYSDGDREILALIIYQEAGGDACSDLTRLRVGSVFMNRVESGKYPDTFKGVACQKGQYGLLHWTGLKWPDRAILPQEAEAVSRAYDCADQVLAGERVLPSDVLFQSEHIQGEIVAESDGLYFCR